MNLNQVLLIGRLGDDAKIRFTPTGKSVASFRLAVNRKYRNGSNELVEVTDWFNVETWQAGVHQYLTKGKEVLVTGRLETDEYEVDGVRRWFTRIVALSVQLGNSPQPKGDDQPE